MSYRLVLDENVEQSVGRRLESLGHDVERVSSVPELGTGTDDERIADYLRETDRVLVTYDDDFRAVSAPVLYVPDETLSGDTITEVVDSIATHYPQSEIDDLVHAGTAWL